MCLHSHTVGLMEYTGIIILLAVLLLAPCIVQTATLSEVTTRADETFRGFLHYYWRHDPSNKTIGFFFACGQVGGMGTPDVWNECGCYTPDRCTNCYRWWDAVALEAVANYGIYTKTKTYKYIPDAIFPHSPYNAKWNATSDCTFVDDFSWYGIAYLRVYEWLQVSDECTTAAADYVMYVLLIYQCHLCYIINGAVGTGICTCSCPA